MSGISLFHIAEQYTDALQTLGDLDLPEEAIADTLEGLQGDLQVKAVNVAAFFQNLDAEAEAIKAAEKRLADRRKAIENRSTRLKEYLRQNMERCEIREIRHELYTLRIQQNTEAVVIDDEGALPAEYVRVKEVRSPDKTALKDALKAGQQIPGARLARGTRLAIR